MDLNDEQLISFIKNRLTWYGQAEFRITAENGEIAYIDPQRLPAQPQPADLILVTHPHSDHFNEEVVDELSKAKTVIVKPVGMAEGSDRGLTVQVGSFTVKGLPAYNPAKKFHPQAQGWLGYLITVDGVTIYHAGDTDQIPEMAGLRPDIALLPVGGTYTMTVAEAAAAVAELGARIVIPMHYGSIVGKLEDGTDFADLVGGKALVLTAQE